MVNVIFDLDGTVTDPGDGFVASISYALSRLGCQVPANGEIRRHGGPPLEVSLGILLGNSRDRVPEAVALYRERYGASGYLENAVYPGVETALSALRSRGAALFVATSKPRVFADRILEHFGLRYLFSAVHGSELDGARSGKAQLIEYLLRVEALSAGATFMVGDRAQDMAGALANGVVPVGALWGYGSREELANAGAAALCEHPSQLRDILPSGPGAS